ncbi:MAG: cytidine deaminase [Candidatus Binatia bacterium]
METTLITKAVQLALEARKRAYVPYSRFRMGAAVGTETGVLIPGSLVANVFLGLAMGAERVALFSTVAQGAGQPILLVLVSARTDGRLTFPCGACLQVAQELGGPDLQIVARDLDGQQEVATIKDLALRLPYKDNT